MTENERTGLMAAGVGALLAFAALMVYLSPGQAWLAEIGPGDLDGGVLAALIVLLAYRGNRPLTPRARILLGVFVAIGLLLGLALRFMA